MRIASIDIGSNTVLMLISELDLGEQVILPIKNYYRIPRLSKGLNSNGIISEEKVFELIDILKDFKKEIDFYGCEKILCVATNAMRMAKNNCEIIEKVFSSTGIKIEIISGNDEARYSFLGATSGKRNESFLLIDIGGGSTEIILGSKSNLKFRESFQIGIVTLFEKYVKEFPVEAEVLELIADEIQIHLKNISFGCDSYTLAISIAGTPTTLAAIKNNLSEYDEEKIEGEFLNIDDMNYFISALQGMSPSEILNRYASIVAGREDLILIGAFCLKTIMEMLNIKETMVSAKGLRYGLAEDYLEKLLSQN